MSLSYNQKFAVYPDNKSGYTMVTAMHPYHGVETYYLSLEDFQNNIKSLLVPFWVNGYTITIISMD